jgi:hypothetical protein
MLLVQQMHVNIIWLIQLLGGAVAAVGFPFVEPIL